MIEEKQKRKKNDENVGHKKVLVHFKMDARLFDDMDKFCKRKNMSRAILIHKATKEYMKLGDKFNTKRDSLSVKGKRELIALAVEWYVENKLDECKS